MKFVAELFLVSGVIATAVASGAKKLSTKSSAKESKALNIDYQIHSNNDLKEFRQVLLKGSRKFKFDPHYVEDSTKCGGASACFLLNHDTPTTSVSTYNTSTELLNYLAGSEFSKLVGDEYISLAFCFKSAPDKCKAESSSFQSWLKLVDDFHAQAVATMPANVEFILDGDAKPAGECDGICDVCIFFLLGGISIVDERTKQYFTVINGNGV